MTTNANYAAGCHNVYNTGLTEVFIGMPWDQTAVALGHSQDGIRPREELLTNKVYGDSRGGQSGSPIEIQDLGEIHYVSFTLTSFNLANVRTLKTRCLRATRTDSTDGGTNAGSALSALRAGTIDPNDIGQFMMKNRACRLLLNTPEVEDVRNYWCAIPESPIEYNMGTKAQEITFGFTCYNPPCGSVKAGILYDAYALLAYNNYERGDAVPTS